jgi:hypothetical protein
MENRIMPRIALMTFSVLRAPYGDPLVQEFDDRTPDVFAEAAGWSGYIDRAMPNPDTPWMTNFQKNWGRWGPFAVPRFYLGGTTSGHTKQAQTLSIWSDLAAVWRFTYRGPLHAIALRKRELWFLEQKWPIYCVWWIDETKQPTWPAACERLEYLHTHGPTPFSFTFKTLFSSGGEPLPATTLKGVAAYTG